METNKQNTDKSLGYLSVDQMKTIIRHLEELRDIDESTEVRTYLSNRMLELESELNSRVVAIITRHGCDCDGSWVETKTARFCDLDEALELHQSLCEWSDGIQYDLTIL